jgi:hypothetical protein
MSTSPGWYPDPAATDGQQRYWDGVAWTEHTAVPGSVQPRTRTRKTRSASKTIVLVGLWIWAAFAVVVLPLQYSGSAALVATSSQLWSVGLVVGLLVVIAGGIVKLVEISQRH